MPKSPLTLFGEPLAKCVWFDVYEQPTHAIGSIAAEQLIKMRFNETVDPPLHIVLKSTLIVRKSSEKRISISKKSGVFL
jgi:DNA-binding LacI/PurR family transcriptional regulator